MRHEIIKTDNYLLVVDESEIKEGDFVCNIQRPYISPCNSIDVGYYNRRNDVFKKVIAHLPLNGSPILEGVDLLPPLEEDDAEKKARELTNHLTFPEERKEGIIIGYNKAKEKYNADLHRILSDFYVFATNGEVCNHKIIDDFIQSLSQPKTPTGFECETSPMNIDEIREQGKGFLNANTNKIKTTTTPEGHTQWVVTYIFN